MACPFSFGTRTRLPRSSGLEQGIEFLLGFFGGRRRAARSAQNRVGRKVVAIIRRFLIANPLGLGFGALVVFTRVVKLAVSAGMEVEVALRANVARADSAPRGILDYPSAFPADKLHVLALRGQPPAGKILVQLPAGRRGSIIRLTEFSPRPRPRVRPRRLGPRAAASRAIPRARRLRAREVRLR